MVDGSMLLFIQLGVSPHIYFFGTEDHPLSLEKTEIYIGVINSRKQVRAAEYRGKEEQNVQPRPEKTGRHDPKYFF